MVTPRALAQFAPLIAATFFMLLWQYTAPKGPLLAAGLLVLWALVSVGALLDGKRWGVALELARLAALAAVLTALRPAGMQAHVVGVLALAGAAGLAAWLLLAARGPAPAAPPAGLVPR